MGACEHRPVVTSLAMPARRRETQLTDLVSGFHPRFGGIGRLHGPAREFLEGAARPTGTRLGVPLATSFEVFSMGWGE